MFEQIFIKVVSGYFTTLILLYLMRTFLPVVLTQLTTRSAELKPELLLENFSLTSKMTARDRA